MKPMMDNPATGSAFLPPTPRVRPEPILRRRPWRQLWEGTLLIVGCALLGVGFDLFLRPNAVASGGVIGLSLVLAHVMPVEPGILQLLVNVLLFVAGWLLLGRSAALRAAVGTALVPLFGSGSV
jgi:uncharacterized membrane-anchored protein YitT (DUF2179 family)